MYNNKSGLLISRLYKAIILGKTIEENLDICWNINKWTSISQTQYLGDPDILIYDKFLAGHAVTYFENCCYRTSSVGDKIPFENS